jgi:hypothetical protein
VSQAAWNPRRAFPAAESKGRFFQAEFRARYPFARLR